jgi:hypothetical protein
MFIDKDCVVNKTSLELLNKIALCTICTGILFDPVQCQTCENCFCKGCINSWLKKSQSCPFKCGSTVYKDSRLVKTILSELIIKCPLDCSNEIKYENIESHFNQCEKNIINCPTCNSRVLNSSIVENKKVKELENEVAALKKENDKLKLMCSQLKELNTNMSQLKLTESQNVPNSVKTKYHEHTLVMTSYKNKGHPGYYGGWICNICRKNYGPTISNLYCKTCQFDLCDDCYKK